MIIFISKFQNFSCAGQIDKGDQFRFVTLEHRSLANGMLRGFLLWPSVPGGGAAEAPGREEGARARGDPEGLWGEQQLHQARQGKAGTEDGSQQGEQGGPAGCYAGAAAGKGTCAPSVCQTLHWVLTREAVNWTGIFNHLHRTALLFLSYILLSSYFILC